MNKGAESSEEECTNDFHVGHVVYGSSSFKVTFQEALQDNDENESSKMKW
jgi:hypothetical protein